MGKFQHIHHKTFADCRETCEALENMIKSGKYRMIPTPDAAGNWAVGYVAAEDYERAMADRQGSIILTTGPKPIIMP